MKKQLNWMRKIALLMACTILIGCISGCVGTEQKNVKETAEGTQESENVQEPEKSREPEKTRESGAAQEDVTLRIGALKGPTTMGLLFLMEDQKAGKTKNSYEFQMATGADELLPLMVSGKLDVALVPANVAAILYQKTEGQIAVINVNTLGVLWLVSGDPSVNGLKDLSGKTVYLTGKGTTPDYVLQYLLKNAGYAEGDVTLEYKSEATEVAAILAQDETAIGFLPQPFVTAACLQNEKLRLILAANDAWKETLGEGNSTGLVTGVTVVRKEILEKYPETVNAFLEEHAASAKAINDDPDTGAKYAVAAGIVGKEAIASKAIPYCNVTCITGEEMKKALQGYLQILFDFDPKTIGGKMPGEDFYY